VGQTDARQGLIIWDDEFRGPRMVLQAETSMPNSSYKDQNQRESRQSLVISLRMFNIR
jgi:hypothetical protein